MSVKAIRLLIEYIETPLPYLAVLISLLFAFGLIRAGELDPTPVSGQASTSFASHSPEGQYAFTFTCGVGPDIHEIVGGGFNLVAFVTSGFPLVLSASFAALIADRSSNTSYFDAIEIRRSVFVFMNVYFFFFAGFLFYLIAQDWPADSQTPLLSVIPLSGSTAQ